MSMCVCVCVCVRQGERILPCNQIGAGSAVVVCNGAGILCAS